MVLFLLQTYFLSCLLKGLFFLFIFLPSRVALKSSKLLLLRIIISLRKGSVQKNQGRGEEGDRKNLNLNSAKPNLFIKYLQSLSEGVKSTSSDQSGLRLVRHCLPLPPRGSV